MNRRLKLIVWMLLCLSGIGVGAEVRVSAAVRFGIYDSPIFWNQELEFCSSQAVLKPSADLLGVSVAELRKLIDVKGLAASQELAITVQHEDAEKARAVAERIRKDFEQSKIAREVSLFKESQSFVIRKLELSHDYKVALAEAQKDYYFNLYYRKVEGAVPSLNLYLEDDSRFNARKQAYQEGLQKLTEDEERFSKMIHQGASGSIEPDEELPVGPTLEQDRMTYEKAKAAAEEAEKE